MPLLDIRRILHPTDFSPYAAGAFAHAVALAEAYGAELHLLHAIVLRGEHAQGTAPATFEEEGAAPRELVELAGRARQRGLQVETAIRRGVYAGPVILDYADDHGIDLTVMATHGRRGPARLLLGSVAEEVLRHSRRAVLTVRTGATAHRGLPVRRVLAAVDLGAPSERVLPAAADLARRFAAHLDVVHVFEQPVRPAAYGVKPSRDLLVRREEIEPRIMQALSDLVAEHAAGVDTTPRLRFGRAGNEILGVAEELGSDLLVIAGAGALHRLLFGSTAEQLLRLAPCPLLVLRGEVAEAGGAPSPTGG